MSKLLTENYPFVIKSKLVGNVPRRWCSGVHILLWLDSLALHVGHLRVDGGGRRQNRNGMLHVDVSEVPTVVEHVKALSNIHALDVAGIANDFLERVEVAANAHSLAQEDVGVCEEK